jgi:hypothetical protein
MNSQQKVDYSTPQHQYRYANNSNHNHTLHTLYAYGYVLLGLPSYVYKVFFHNIMVYGDNGQMAMGVDF